MRQSMRYIGPPKENEVKNGMKTSMLITPVPSKEKLDFNMQKA